MSRTPAQCPVAAGIGSRSQTPACLPVDPRTTLRSSLTMPLVVMWGRVAATRGLVGTTHVDDVCGSRRPSRGPSRSQSRSRSFQRRYDRRPSSSSAARRPTSASSRRLARWRPIEPLHDDPFVIFPCHASTRRRSSPARRRRDQRPRFGYDASGPQRLPTRQRRGPAVASDRRDELRRLRRLQRYVDPGPRDDVHGAGPADQQPTDPGRPAGRATVLARIEPPKCIFRGRLYFSH